MQNSCNIFAIPCAILFQNHANSGATFKVARPKTKNPHYPPNLYESNGYFRWRNPDTKKFVSLGTSNEKEAIKLAKGMNRKLVETRVANANAGFIEAVGNNKSFLGKYHHSTSEVVKRFIGEYLDEINQGQTLKEKTTKAHRVSAFFADQPIVKLDNSDWNEFLKAHCHSNNVYGKYKVIIRQLYEFCREVGLIPITHPNIADIAKVRKLEKADEKNRHDMTLEQFKALYQEAEPWLQAILKFGFLTGLREGDILNLKYSQIKDGWLYVIPAKTKGNSQPRKLKFKIEEQLESCGLSEAEFKYRQRHLPSCEFVFIKDYQKYYFSRTKEHPNQILSRHFCEQYEAVWKGIEKPCWQYYLKGECRKEVPTFHSIRGLQGKVSRGVLNLEPYELSMRYGHKSINDMPVAIRPSPTTEIYVPDDYYPIETYVNFDQVLEMNNEVIDSLYVNTWNGGGLTA